MELRNYWRYAVGSVLLACALLTVAQAQEQPPIDVSGRYPSLATLNHQGECGTGAVVNWADRLWVITYAPHAPHGSDDKLYEIDGDLHRLTCPESIGGTPAGRLVHTESNQLIIGPYFIDAQRNVRVIPPSRMPGRFTAAARDLTDPANKVYIYDMEGALFEVDVHTLEVKKLFARSAPGHHGKGAYTGQGRLVIANNGNSAANKAEPAAADPGYADDPESSGALAEWDGKNWRVLERREFTDVTGPGGVRGSPDQTSPLWTIGWDRRSVILKVLDAGQWHDYRLPVADFSYVARHGWYTEWPRIREVTGGHYLMNMHGQWFEFPKTFAAANTGGIRPLGSYLKITGDFCPWRLQGKDRIVFGCDDASFMNNPLCGQSASNLWFTTWDDLKSHGKPAGSGGPWLQDAVKAGEASVPYLIGGYSQRVVHLAHDSDQPVTFTLESDADGHGQWTTDQSITVPPHGYAWYVFPDTFAAQWIRVKTDHDCGKATAYFNYGPGGGTVTDRAMFESLADVNATEPWHAETVRPLGKDKGTLWYDSVAVDPSGKPAAPAAYEVSPDLNIQPYGGAAVTEPKSIGFGDAYHVSQDDASIVIQDGTGRYRLPISSTYDHAGISVRPIRECVTERFLLNAGGSFFMVPYPTAGGASRIKPICTHDKRISDFCSWRGLMVLAGTRDVAKPDGHYFTPGNGAPGVWLGDIDDLWKLGTPHGHGGPWKATSVRPGEWSDPYLMDGYDQKTLTLSHDSAQTVHVTLQVNPAADANWFTYQTFDVPAGQPLTFTFPKGYSAHWLRVGADVPCHATAQLEY
jgi:hypothetical protein